MNQNKWILDHISQRDSTDSDWPVLDAILEKIFQIAQKSSTIQSTWAREESNPGPHH